MKFTAQQVADFLGGKVEGDAQVKVSEFAKIEEAGEGSLTFLANPKYTSYVYETKASVILVSDDITFENEVETTLVRVANAYESLAKLMQIYDKAKPQKKGKARKSCVAKSAKVGKDCYIGEFAVIESHANVGNNVKIYPNSYIGDDVTIGDNTIIYPNVTIYKDCVIGANCVLHSGCVIGADGFGFAPSDADDYEKIPQIGNVIIEDKVEIGANTTVDRATMGSTVVKTGVKIDNLVQVAHNAEIGSHTVIAAQAGISGSTKIGHHVMIGGQVGFAGHITVADNVKIGAQSGLSNSVKQDGAVLMGYPAVEMSKFRRQAVVAKNLPDMQRTITRLERELNKLKEGLAQ